VIALHLVRHAQASFAAEDYDQLSPLGLAQARRLGEALAARRTRVDAVFTGTLRRHRQTAEACLSAAGLAALPLRALPGLDEVDHAELLVRLDPRYADRTAIAADLAARGGPPDRAFQALFADAFARWIGGRHDDAYAVSWPAFRRRSEAALEALLRSLSPSASALAFTSGGPITAICLALLGLPDPEAPRIAWTLVNTGVTKVLHGRAGTRLSTLNEHAHLEGGGERMITYR
jgi:broad specificity phosphatase PhoE